MIFPPFFHKNSTVISNDSNASDCKICAHYTIILHKCIFESYNSSRLIHSVNLYFCLIDHYSIFQFLNFFTCKTKLKNTQFFLVIIHNHKRNPPFPQSYPQWQLCHFLFFNWFFSYKNGVIFRFSFIFILSACKTN